MKGITDINALKQIIHDYLRSKASQKKIQKVLDKRKQIQIEVGAGNKKGNNGWLTIDISNQCDIYWDLRKGLPFPNESITKIYSSHFLEHLSFKESQTFLDECIRVLVHGGVFSICVPNARIYIESYLDPDSQLPEDFFVYKPAFNRTTKIDYLNYIAYMDGHHQYMFDEENLIFLLQSKGFQHVRLREFDPSLDLQMRDFESIYAEALK
jgi:predicted SAM-dependent methyltransferase